MTQSTAVALPNMFPFLRYKDPAVAIDWLADAFGFEKRMEARGPDGAIVHAEMSYGPGVIMLGPGRENDELGMRSPSDAGGVTQGIYVRLDDPDAHYERAKAAGAEIVRAIENTDYGSREYAARDLEGHLWSFGTYRPGD